MKIVAHTDGGYLVEVSAGELKTIAGYDVVNETSRRGYQHSMIGCEFDIAAAWARIRDLLWRQDELGKAAGAMRALADLLTDKLEVVTLPPEPKVEADG